VADEAFKNKVIGIIGLGVVASLIATWIWTSFVPPPRDEFNTTQIRARRYLALGHTLTLLKYIAVSQPLLEPRYRAPDIYTGSRTVFVQEAHILGIEGVEADIPELVSGLGEAEALLLFDNVLPVKIKRLVEADGAQYLRPYEFGLMFGEVVGALYFDSPSDSDMVKLIPQVDHILSALDKHQLTPPEALGLTPVEQGQFLRLIRDVVMAIRNNPHDTSDAKAALLERSVRFISAMKDGIPYTNAELENAPERNAHIENNTSTSPESIKTFIKAVATGDITVVNTLLRSGLNPDSTVDGVPSALSIAVFRSDVDMVALLLKGGADPERDFLNTDGTYKNLRVALAAVLYLERIKAKSQLAESSLKEQELPTDDQAESRYIEIQTLIDLRIKERHSH
jgi:hypothetical protein